MFKKCLPYPNSEDFLLCFVIWVLFKLFWESLWIIKKFGNTIWFGNVYLITLGKRFISPIELSLHLLLKITRFYMHRLSGFSVPVCHSITGLSRRHYPITLLLWWINTHWPGGGHGNPHTSLPENPMDRSLQYCSPWRDAASWDTTDAWGEQEDI